MIGNGTHHQVLIVGAGPSGLMMAAQLLRFGVQPVVIDIKQGPTGNSNAIAVQARSLEIYRQMNLSDKLVKDGKQARGITVTAYTEEIANLSLNNIGEGETLFPFVDLYPQNKNEKVLLDYLTLNCCPVYWETSLVSLKQKEQIVETQLKRGDEFLTITNKYVIGADGAHSTVRKLLNIPFNGGTYQHRFYLADVQLGNGGLEDNRLHVFLAKKGIAAFFPLPEKDRFRIISAIPDAINNKSDLELNDVLPDLKNITGFAVIVVENYWFSAYRLHHRMAAKFSDRHCFLIGDAAHIHSPVGGQGMNTGLQDAYNLAWKLAGVLNKQFNKRILDSYGLERIPVAKNLLHTTDRAFTLIMSGNRVMGLFKKWALPAVLNRAWAKKEFREGFFKKIAQIGIKYRESPLSLHLSNATKIKAGDRLPYMKLYDEKRLVETDLHEWCNKPGFTLIVFGKFEEVFLFNVARWITMKYANLLNFFYLPPTGKNLDIFEAFEINPRLQKAIIVRPDMHIGFMNDEVDLKLMDNYLSNVVGVV